MKTIETSSCNCVLRPIAVAITLLVAGHSSAQVATLSEVVVVGEQETYAVTRSTAGTRTDTPVEQIPQSVISVNRTLIEDQGVKTVSDALRNVSNVNVIDPRDTNIVSFKVRGFNSAVVVDGVAMPGPFSNLESLVNVEQIDVLKGPAGNLFGSGQGIGAYATLGGTIAVTTSSPERTPIRNVGISAGNYGAAGAQFDLNQPLSDDFAARLVGEVSRSNSESDNIFFRKQAFFPSLAWTPNAGRSVVIKARSIKGTTLDYSGLPKAGTLDTSSFTMPRSTNFTANGLPDTVTESSGLNIQWTEKLNKTWTANVTVAQNTAFINEKGVYVGDAFCGYGNAAATYHACGLQMWEKFETTSLSPNLTGKFEAWGASHVLSAGVDIESTKDKAFMAYSNGTADLGAISITNPVMPVWVDPVVPAEKDQQNNTYESRVIYVQEQASIGNLHLTGGLRFSRIDVVDIYNDGMMFSNNNVSSNTKWTPRVGAAYEWTPSVSTFAGYTEGMKTPVGSNFATTPKPEESSQKEVGLRFKNAGGITGTVAWFDLQRTNAAITDQATFKSYQTGKQRSTGVDVDLQWRASNALTLLATFTAQTARIVEDSLNASLVDKQLFNVPERSARLAARYSASGNLAGWGAGLGVTYRDVLPGDNKNTYFTDAATVWDTQLSYQSGKARYGMGISNLLDKKYYVPSAYFSGGNVTPAAPRTWVVTANYSF